MTAGATPARVVAEVIAEAVKPLMFGIAAGAALAYVVLRAFQSLLFDVAPADLFTFAAVCALLVSVALAAALIPGRRAASIDPIYALRDE